MTGAPSTKNGSSQCRSSGPSDVNAENAEYREGVSVIGISVGRAVNAQFTAEGTMPTKWPRSHDEIALELDSIQDERPTEDCKYGHYLCSEEYMGPCTEERESRLYVELANAD